MFLAVSVSSWQLSQPTLILAAFDMTCFKINKSISFKHSAVTHLSLMDICLEDMPSDSCSPESVGDSRSPEWTLCLLKSSLWSKGRDWDLISAWGKD